VDGEPKSNAPVVRLHLAHGHTATVVARALLAVHHQQVRQQVPTLIREN
jgi:hypothetical protein